MNKQRRDILRQALVALDLAESHVSDSMDDEQSALDNLPESFQDSDRGAAFEDNIDRLNDAIDLIGQAYDLIEETINA